MKRTIMTLLVTTRIKPSKRLIQCKSVKMTLMAFALTLVGCGSLLPAPPPATAFYALDGLPVAQQQTANSQAHPTTQATLLVATPRAASGYETQHMMYKRQAHQLAYYAQSEWLATPAKMLTPLMIQAIERSGGFSNVVMAPSHVMADYRLETEIIRLHQAFDRQPSAVQLTVRATLVSNATRKVVAVREFDEVVVANSENAYGGVVAANVAVQNFLEKLTAFCHASLLKAQ